MWRHIKPLLELLRLKNPMAVLYMSSDVSTVLALFSEWLSLNFTQLLYRTRTDRPRNIGQLRFELWEILPQKMRLIYLGRGTGA